MIRCTNCAGLGWYWDRLMNHRTKTREQHYLMCDSCKGKGYLTQGDIDRYYATWRFAHEVSC